MKNIQVISAADNCTFSFFQATEEEFQLIFPEERQDIQYSEDLEKEKNRNKIYKALNNIWDRPVRKQDVNGVHGTIFYKLERYKNYYYEKREECIVTTAINRAQRRLFGVE